MLATAGFVLIQVPPDVGDIDEVLPIQIEVGPVKTMVGIALTVTNADGLDTHPVASDVSTNPV